MGQYVQVLPLCPVSCPSHPWQGPLFNWFLQISSLSRHCHEQVKVHCDLVLVGRDLDLRISCPECEPSGPAPQYLHTP